MRAIAIAVLLATGTGCGGLDEVDVTRSAIVPIQGDPAGGPPRTVSGFRPAPRAEDALREEGLERGDIDAARMVRLRVEVLAGASFERWLEDVVVIARADGLPDVVIAEKHGVAGSPPDTRVLELEVTDMDLDRYLLGGSPMLGVEGTGVPPLEDTTLRITGTARVDVDVSDYLF